MVRSGWEGNWNSPEIPIRLRALSIWRSLLFACISTYVFDRKRTFFKLHGMQIIYLFIKFMYPRKLYGLWIPACTEREKMIPKIIEKPILQLKLYIFSAESLLILFGTTKTNRYLKNEKFILHSLRLYLTGTLRIAQIFFIFSWLYQLVLIFLKFQAHYFWLLVLILIGTKNDFDQNKA